MALIARDMCFQTLALLEINTQADNTKDLVEMFKALWARPRPSSNMHTGIRSATIEVLNARDEDISEPSQDLALIKNKLGVVDTKITLRHWDPRSWRF